MHKSQIGAMIIDCQVDDLGEAATFWTEALGGDAVTYPDDPNYIGVKGAKAGPKVLLQKVGHPSHIHLDIETDDIESEVERLEKLGAKRVDALKGWVVMEAPTGHRFCVVKPQRRDFKENAKVWYSK